MVIVGKESMANYIGVEKITNQDRQNSKFQGFDKVLDDDNDGAANIFDPKGYQGPGRNGETGVTGKEV